MKIESDVCEHCGQTLNYFLAIDLGTCDIVKKIAEFIGKKGINAVHPRKEMEGLMLTSNQVGNLSRARFHGLIAKIKENPGNYCLTRKGSQFLRGMPIPKTAIISKKDKKQVGYLEEEKVTIFEFIKNTEYWNGINYEILEGNVIHRFD